MQEFINFQPTEKEKDKKSDDNVSLRYSGGLDILMEYFVNMDEEGRFVVCFFPLISQGKTWMTIFASFAFEHS